MVQPINSYLSIPDIHGDVKLMQTALNTDISSFKKIIFHGDYVDAKDDITNAEILHCLEQIIQFKLKYPEKVVLLWGNHDIQYYNWFDINYRCTGTRNEMGINLYAIFKKNEDLFKIAYQDNNYLFTHAGITDYWFRKNYKILSNFAERFEMNLEKELGAILNRISRTKDKDILFTIGSARSGIRSYETGGPLWADWGEFHVFGPLEGFHQIVGHNKIKDIYRLEDGHKTSVTFIDCNIKGIKITIVPCQIKTNEEVRTDLKNDHQGKCEEC